MSDFTIKFLTYSSPDQDNSSSEQQEQQITTLYNGNPVYMHALMSDHEEATISHVLKFYNSNYFDNFRSQYQLLITKISDWCKANGLAKYMAKHNDFDSFLGYIFPEHSAVFAELITAYSHLKHLLEKFCIALLFDNIALESKKIV